MPNHPQAPKPPYQNNPSQNRKKGWENVQRQHRPPQNLRETHLPKGLGKHRKSFGHV